MSSEAGETNDELTVQPFESSKREYLLAQIRQKDAIIESLLKQVGAQLRIVWASLTLARTMRPVVGSFTTPISRRH